MLRKAYTPARLFTESILFLLMGSLMLLHPEKTLVLALDALRWLLPAGGIINLTEWLLHGRQKRIALVKGGGTAGRRPDAGALAPGHGYLHFPGFRAVDGAELPV